MTTPRLGSRHEEAQRDAWVRTHGGDQGGRGAVSHRGRHGAQTRSSNPVARVLKLLGPGLIAGAADDDPTGIGTYAQAGAQTGYGLLWTALLTLPMMITVQYLATKIAAVEGQGLAALLRRHYSRPVLYTAVLGLIVANVINAGADLGAIAAAVNLEVPIPVRALVIPVALLILGFMVFGDFNLIQNVFKWLTLALLAYIVSSVLARPNVLALLAGTFIPQITTNQAFLALLVATLGGNVSPYLFFWQSDLEVADERDQGIQPEDQGRAQASRGAARRLHGRLKGIAWDTIVGMVFSNVIIYFIEVATAATLFTHGSHTVSSAAHAAAALRPLLGGGATLLWSIGMIGSGILAVPALTGSAADAVAATFGWRHGLEQKPHRAVHFYVILAIAMLVGMGINFLPINPIQALVISAALNGILTPPLLVLLMLLGNRRDVMGEHTNRAWLNLCGWGTIVIMSVAALGLLISLL